MNAPRLFARIIVPRPLEGTFTYEIPAELASRVRTGMRAIVPFGSKRYVTGIIESLSPVRPTDIPEIKPAIDLPDASPTVIHPQIKLWEWMAEYYMCPIGDVYKAALPSGLKPESETVVTVNPEIDADSAALSSDDAPLLALVSRKGKIAVNDLAKELSIKNIESRVSHLVEEGILTVHESMSSRYKRMRMHFVTPTLPRGDSGALAVAFDSVRRSAAQEKALLAVLSLSDFNNRVLPLKSVDRHTLLDSSPDFTWEHVKALQRKGLVEIEQREVSRFGVSPEKAVAPLPTLSDDQSNALKAIHESFKEYNVTLLHGVTSSGKTEIYIHLIDFILKEGRQALFLVPEIALTAQLTRRLQNVFGRLVKIYHSKFTDNERIDIWRDMLANPGPCVVIGARSAVFLPFTNLGLVVVDEEHDPSYKQTDPSPRYNGRDAAIMLATMHGAKTLLGSATPSIETYYKATEGRKYGLVSLATRYGDVCLPSIVTIDMGHERMRKAVDGPLCHQVIAAGRHAVAEGRQVIMFHNRRGYSPKAQCRLCTFVPKCDRCDVSLTYHKRSNTLECHYCGATYPVPKVCPNCHEPTIEIKGYGTERVEDDIQAIYPEARLLRMDLDTTRNKDAYIDIVDKFSNHQADILVGTQMVTKGLDFGLVKLVVVVNADHTLHYPDFRSNERAFNLLEQVSGRAGRRNGAGGEVMIQTYTPDHPILGFVSRHDYAGYYAYEIEERRKWYYPPFARIINIYIKHRDRATVDKVAREYADRLRHLLGNRVNGPVEPPVARIASLYIRRIMLRIESQASIRKVKDILRELYITTQASPTSRGITLYYDVDPC